jgi:RNA polymerase sigma factor for flagellar operon FliA
MTTLSAHGPCDPTSVDGTASAALSHETGAGAESSRASNADVERHLTLVNQVVARFMRRLPANVDRGDLVAAGMYGLVTSLERNGGDSGTTFEGYAKMRIRGAILDELRAQDWLSRRARWAANEHSADYAGPTALVGLDDVGEGERGAHMVDDSTPNALSALEAVAARHELEGAVAQLPERERTIVAMHYFEGVRFKDIGALLGVSEPRISQLHARAIGRLRDLLAEAA